LAPLMMTLELMATTVENLDRLKTVALSGALAKASTGDLEQYAAALCHAQAFSHFGTHEFPQICETVRLHLLRAHIETIERRASRYQWLVVALAVASLISSIVQIYVQVLQQQL